MTQKISSARYDEIIDKLKECVRNYEIALQNNKYTLGLANGDNIVLTFPQNSIAHLLGINIDELRRANIISLNVSSYDALKKLTESDLTYYSMQKINYNFDISDLFSEYIDSKLEIFNDILKVRTDDMHCIIKYVSERAYASGVENENSDYFIIRKHNKKFSALGICKNKESDSYKPVTSRLFDNNSDFYNFLEKCSKNQEITYPYSFQIENHYSFEPYSKKFYMNPYDKNEFIRTLKDIATIHKAIPSTNRDFQTMLSRYLNNQQKNSNNFEIITMIKENILSRNIIDKEEVIQMLDNAEIPKELELLIDACNDIICSNSLDNESVNDSYSTIQNENISLKSQLEELKAKVLESQAKYDRLNEDYSLLKQDNETTNNKLKVLTNAFESIK